MLRFSFFSLFLSIFTVQAFANEPSVVFLGSGAKEKPVAMINIEEAMTAPGDGCTQLINEVVVSEVTYDGSSEIINGFRVNPAKNIKSITLYRISSDKMTSYDNDQLQRIVKKGARLIVLAQICGSGGFTSVREIWLKNAIGQW